MLSTILFIIFAAGAVAGSVLMVIQRNPLVSALYLVMAFCCIAGIYFMLNAPLIGIFQIIIYAGAIMVLFIFVIMLLNLSRPPGISFRLFFVKVVGIILAFLLLWTAFNIIGGAIPEFGGDSSIELMNKGDFRPDTNVPPSVTGSNIKQFGWSLFSKWVYPFEIVSVILLVAVVGTVLFSKREVK